MVQLNSAGECADFVNESQFEGGESAYECVAFSAALIKYCGQPGHGPTGTGEQIDQLADQWYGTEEGSYAAANQNGMSLPAEYAMLQGMSMHYHALPISDSSQPADDITNVKAWLKLGYPVMICGAETGFYDLTDGKGDVVPYSWTPTGNHCIVACGIASDGNLLVRDTASIASTGVRPGPRRYDASKMQLISGTAIEVSWLPSLPANFDPAQGGEPVSIDLSNPSVSAFFQAVPTNSQQWLCKSTGKIIQYGILAFYQAFGGNALCGLTYLGLPKTNETPIEQYPNFQHLAGSGPSGIVAQEYERADVVYDPGHKVDNPPGSGTVYLLHAGELVTATTGLDPVTVKNRLAAMSLAAQQVVTLAAQPIT